MSPTRSLAVVLLVPAIIVAALLVAANAKPTEIAAVPSQSPNGSAGAPSGGATGLPAAPTAWPYPPLPTPTPHPCDVLASLPVPDAPIATPAVAADGVSLLFSSNLYGHGRNGSLAVLDDPGTNWAMGLWYKPVGATAPRLLATAPNGMVLPLALSPSGELAAVWWLPDRRGEGDPACDGGIYIVSTTTGTSHLVVRRDWTDTDGPDGALNDARGVLWTDPATGPTGPRTYRLPEAAFSADGQFLTLIDRSQISIYFADETTPRWTHTGSCSSWAWSPGGARFVAGCEAMTSAWIVDAADGSTAASLALPWLGTAAGTTGWGETSASALGLTNDGHIRLAGFFGVPTGCEGTGPCHIPSPAYEIVTVDPATGDSVVRSAKVEFLAETGNGGSLRFSIGAGWLYVQGEPIIAGPGARTVTVDSGRVTSATPLAAVVGGSLDGAALFGSRDDVERRTEVLLALDAAGATRWIGTIAWAAGASGLSPVIDVFGLRVTAARP